MGMEYKYQLPTNLLHRSFLAPFSIFPYLYFCRLASDVSETVKVCSPQSGLSHHTETVAHQHNLYFLRFVCRELFRII